MNTAAPASKADEIARRFDRDAALLESYKGSQLAQPSGDGVSTWDVSAQARREQARYESAASSESARRATDERQESAP